MELNKAFKSQNDPQYEIYDPNEGISILNFGPNEPKGGKIVDRDPMIVKYHILYIHMIVNHIHIKKICSIISDGATWCWTSFENPIL